MAMFSRRKAASLLTTWIMPCIADSVFSLLTLSTRPLLAILYSHPKDLLRLRTYRPQLDRPACNPRPRPQARRLP
eukprot:4268068-Pleurochrysis_carterae.AAC.1